MAGMFSGCATFNQPLARWDVAKVTRMSSMFFGCSSFNQSLEAWKINELAYPEMIYMFASSPAGELPFVRKWEAAGGQFLEVECNPAEDDEEMEEE